jgi:hypothetical protein
MALNCRSAAKERSMNPVALGLLGGVAFGIVDVLLMLPMQFPDKRTALIGAFLSRFAIGFLIPLSKLPMPLALAGAIIGLLISLPDAVITKAYVPIIGTGIVGGAILGWVAGRFAA